MIIRKNDHKRLMVPFKSDKGYVVLSPGLNIIDKIVWDEIKDIHTVARDIANQSLIIESDKDGELAKAIPALKSKSLAAATELIKSTSDRDVLRQWGNTADTGLKRLIKTQIEMLDLKEAERAGII